MVTYTLTMIILLGSTILPFIIEENGDEYVSISLYVILCAVSAVQLITYIFMNLVSINTKAAFVVEIIILAIYVVLLILWHSANLHIINENKYTVQKCGPLETALNDVELLFQKVTDDSLKKELNRLADEIRYSDLVSTPETASYDNEINSNITELKNNLDIELISNTILLLKERNIVCKKTK